MALLNLLQLLQTDDQATVIDKINFNLDQILSLGGGPPGATGFTGNQGIPGQQGIQGFQGNAGNDGAYWFVQSSSITPTVPTPKDGDLWLQTDNNNVLQYTGSPLTWTVVGNLSAPNRSGVVRSNGNIYISGDEDGGGPGIDGDTILAYDSILNQVRGNVRIHGDIITGITSPAGWITTTLTSSDVNSSDGGSVVSANLASAIGAVLSYKIIGKTVFLNFFIDKFNNGTLAATYISILLPTAIQGVKSMYTDPMFLDADMGAMGGGSYESASGNEYFGIECLLMKSNNAAVVGGFLNSWTITCRPLHHSGTGPDYFVTGGEIIRGTLTFELI